MLEVQHLDTGYGPRQIVVRDASFTVPPGQVTALLGPNGAGKTTTLLAMSGELRAMSGSIVVDGEDVSRVASHRRCRKGVVLVSQERNLFPGISVRDHLELAATVIPPRDGERGAADRVARVEQLFPALVDKRSLRAGSLSGGQQQQLAIARALVLEPTYLLLDEPLGLDPLTTSLIMERLTALAGEGMGVLLVEQHAAAALEVATDVVVMQGGRIRTRTTATELQDDANLLDLYLGGV